MAENTEVGSARDDGNDITVKKSSLMSKNLNKAVRYLTSKAKLAII